MPLYLLTAATKKRKAPESTAAATAKATGPQKKAALGTATSTKPAPVKKEVKPVTAASVKDAKADSSFFSAPKPKQKLPSFKKAPPVPLSTKKEDAVAQPSNFDPFKEALKSMKVARKESPAVSTPPPQSASSTASVADSLNQTSLNARNLKKKKSVSWAPEGQLEAIKLIDKAIYDDDPVDVSTFSTLLPPYRSLIPLRFFLFRVYTWHIASATWTGEKEQRCTLTSSKKQLIGQSLLVSKLELKVRVCEKLAD